MPDKIEDAEKAFTTCNLLLRHDGLLIIGWNDRAGRKLYDLKEIESLNQFSPYTFPPLETNLFQVKSFTNHVYQFFLKKYPSNI